MIYDDIRNFHTQFAYEPKIENEKRLGRFKKFIFAGMGGSLRAADILRVWQPKLSVVLWNDYGLPQLSEQELRERLIIASSYSGNTEEAISALFEAKRRHLSVAVVAAGGKLIGLAKKYKLPYVEMPDAYIQPRMALGFSMKALLKITGKKKALRETRELVDVLRPARYESSGRILARRLKGAVPVIYSSRRNLPVAYTWKIKLNETGKIPAFYNVLPELNHNEMIGFDVKRKTRSLSSNFRFIILKDPNDSPRILKRMNVLAKLYQDRNFWVETIVLRGKTELERIFSSLILADWVAYYSARQYGVEAEQVPMVEEFKKLIRG